jgi:hypothetical protein
MHHYKHRAHTRTHTTRITHARTHAHTHTHAHHSPISRWRATQATIIPRFTAAASATSFTHITYHRTHTHTHTQYAGGHSGVQGSLPLEARFVRTIVTAHTNTHTHTAATTLLLHCCYTVVTPLLHCCYTVVTLLASTVEARMGVGKLLEARWTTFYTLVATVVTLLLHCCYTVVYIVVTLSFTLLQCISLLTIAHTLATLPHTRHTLTTPLFQFPALAPFRCHVQVVLSIIHTHTHTHANTHTQTHTRTHTHNVRNIASEWPLSPPYTHTQTPYTLTHTRTHICFQCCTHCFDK